jgi:predicted AAA+ superfamily ATPase
VGYLQAEQDLENRLVFGFYPDVLNNPEESTLVLKELMESYLYKDILIVGNLNKPLEINKLLQALAYQTGSEVSMRELSEIAGIDPKTVDRYIDILEKAFVIFRLNPLSRNLRNEIKKNRKIYFYDNGIRNALIGQLQPLSIRQDKGQLWENFLMSERKKVLDYQNSLSNSFFWRTKQQQEVDYVEEVNGNFSGYEFKWSEKKGGVFPKTFSAAYNSANFVVSRKNFRDFVR